MRKCCFIIPYFGKLPNYFPLFLKSCAYNPDFDWLLYTDDMTEFTFPENVHVSYLSFADMQKKVQQKFDFKVALDRPYKLCDLKPAYGYIFEEEIKEYRFWGHCDTDILVGNLNEFLPDTFMEQYDKIFALGHMTIYRNSEQNNRVFMSEYNEKIPYKEAYKNPENVVFDEECMIDWNVNRIFLAQGKKVYTQDLSLNFGTRNVRFIRTIYTGKDNVWCNEEDFPAVYLWNKGNIERYYMDKGSLTKETFPYVHLQNRKMRYEKKVEEKEVIKIVPNYFLPLEYDEVTAQNFKKIRKNVWNAHVLNLYYWQYRARFSKRVKDILGIK